MTGQLIYKCKRCGKEENNFGINDELVFLNLMHGLPIPNQLADPFNTTLKKSYTHFCNCAEGKIGVMELAGFQPDGFNIDRGVR